MKNRNLDSQKLLTEHLEEVIESSYDGIFITDGKANVIYLNSAYERITGVKRNELLGKNMDNLVKDNIISRSATLIVLKEKKVTTISQAFKTGHRALVTSTPIFNENNEIILVVTNVRDISELENLKSEMDKSDRLLKQYVSQIEEFKAQMVKDNVIIGKDPRMISLLQNAKRVAQTDTTVLLLGETGSGKEEIARYIYKNSLRASGAYIKVNCGAIPENLLESEFFGYEDGAFTGAKKGGKMGLFELANDGTIFLDEVSEIPLNMQVKLLRVLQEGTITKIGGDKELKIDVRIIAATNKDLEKMVKEGTFREDLYYRLNVIPIIIPPIRERKGDIILFVKHFMDKYNNKYSVNKKIDSEIMDVFYNYSWPGNVRQMKNVIERMVLLNDESQLTIKDVPEDILKTREKTSINKFEAVTLKEAVAALEYEMITKAYEKYENVRDAAKSLGIDASTLVRKRQRYEK